MSLVKKFNKLQIIVAMCVMICLTVNISTVTAFAAGGGAFGITDELDGLEGDGKYLSQEYRDNYQLDIEKLGKCNRKIFENNFTVEHFTQNYIHVIRQIAEDE